jgi:dTDP-4-amino-4,6-dideoxygalactose transaminase
MSSPARDRPPIAFIDLQAQRARLGDRIDQAIAGVLRHGQYILGPEVARLEAALAAFCGAGHAIGCANGTDALGMALMALDVRPGDAVLVPTFTFAATAEAVAWLGAHPVFVDVSPDTFNMDPASLAQAIDVARRHGLAVRGVITVDLFGQPADYERIEPIAAEHGLWLMCDAAQSFGAAYGERRVGQVGRITTTSFFPAKPLGCYGDGGAILTDEPALAEALRSIRVHGQGKDKYDNVRIGINGRLDTLQAAILIEKLEIFGSEIAARQLVAERYERALAGLVVTPTVLPNATSVWAQYTIRVPRRDEIAARLKASGVPTAVYYHRPLHRQTAYRDYVLPGLSLEVAEALADEVLSLPMHPYLEPMVQERIVTALRDALS